MWFLLADRHNRVSAGSAARVGVVTVSGAAGRSVSDTVRAEWSVSRSSLVRTSWTYEQPRSAVTRPVEACAWSYR
ncbi:hypothetical protein ADL04_01545 [Streptomyces sp. NRRL B-3648]|nr:hypothetical protein ADL04_01545 [Streptomyces sp. NRRL B-3648]